MGQKESSAGLLGCLSSDLHCVELHDATNHCTLRSALQVATEMYSVSGRHDTERVCVMANAD